MKPKIIKTCKHLRFLIPQDDADELRKDDKEYCVICDDKEIRSDVSKFLINLKNINEIDSNGLVTPM